MNNCDKLKICARIKISPAIFITREIFADDSVYARLIPPSEAGEYLGPTVTVWTSCPSQASSNPSMRYKTLQEKWLFHRLSDRKLDAPAACKIGSEIMIHHPAVTARPWHRNKRVTRPTQNASPVLSTIQKIVRQVQMKRIKIYLYRVCIF